MHIHKGEGWLGSIFGGAAIGVKLESESLVAGADLAEGGVEGEGENGVGFWEVHLETKREVRKKDEGGERVISSLDYEESLKMVNRTKMTLIGPSEGTERITP